VNIKIIEDSFKEDEVFHKDSFSLKFEYKNKQYNVIVNCNKQQLIELEESNLIIRTFCGEYILNNKKINFQVTIIYERYITHEKFNNYTVFSTYSVL